MSQAQIISNWFLGHENEFIIQSTNLKPMEPYMVEWDIHNIHYRNFPFHHILKLLS